MPASHFSIISSAVEGVTGTMTWNADGNTNKATSAILYKNGEGTLFGQNSADAADTTDTAEGSDTAE